MGFFPKMKVKVGEETRRDNGLLVRPWEIPATADRPDLRFSYHKGGGKERAPHHLLGERVAQRLGL